MTKALQEPWSHGSLVTDLVSSGGEFVGCKGCVSRDSVA